ncbi:hypothetical protein [Actinokineospora xionganensis]|uniref:hypothetical protein n=1 Tax=Actinokineospora xionganensis TaxID=2684470 RepID=UPI001C9BDFEE|nr:hypothetical protein [Actinokineospora xionganensis]
MNDIAARPVIRKPRPLPTVPCSVVWSKGHPFVLERFAGTARWVGMDTYGRPCALTPTALDSQGWSHRRA